MDTTGKRVKDARTAMGLTQAQLAERVGCKQADIFRIESGEVKHSKYLSAVLRILNIDSSSRVSIPLVGYVGAGCEVLAINDHQENDGFEMLPAPPGMVNGIALIVRGDSMSPKYEDGEILFIEKTVYSVESLIGENCYVQLADGRAYVKRLQYGSKPGLFTLISYNAAPIIDVPVERVYPIAYTKPKYRILK